MNFSSRTLRHTAFALTLALAGGLAVTPTLQLRARALEAVQQHTSLQQQVAPQLLQREAMVKSVDLLASLQALAGQPVSTLRVIDLVTRAMPDDASLLTFQLLASDPAAKGPKVIMTGQATNAAALMQQLSNQPGIREVKAPSAAVKPLGAIKESFSIEFVVDFAALPATAAATGQP